MIVSIRSALKPLLRGIAWLLFVAAGLAFWFGGRAISEFGKVDRVLAEMEGIGLAVVTGGIGFVLKTAADDLLTLTDLKRIVWLHGI